MNGILEKVEITEKNFEELCLLAEDVVHQLYMDFSAYDAEGNDIFMKHYRKDGNFKGAVRPLILQERAAMEALPENRLLYDLFRRGDEIGAVRYYTVKEIRPWIEPILPKALNMLRKGTRASGETPYRAADSVSDDLLTAAFAREVRNMMMIFAAQRLQAADTQTAGLKNSDV